MSKAQRLPSIINRYILEKWLGVKCREKFEVDSLIPLILDQQQIVTPFFAHFAGSCIFDSFYFISASSSISLPTNSNILITDWKLTYAGTLHLEILQAELSEESFKQKKSELISIEKNPAVFSTLQRFKYEKIKKTFVVDLNEDEENLKICLASTLVPVQTVENPKTDSEDDVCNMIELNYPDPISAKKNRTTHTSQDVGIEIFPPYALEYLKHKYNIV